MADGGPLADVRGFASKAPEQALRLAAVITFVEGHRERIGVEHVERAIELMNYYLFEAQRLCECDEPDPELETAEMVLTWMKRQEQPVRLQRVYQCGPRGVRNAEKARRIMAKLVQHRQVRPVAGQGEAWETVTNG